MASTAITMVQNVVSMISQNSIDKLNNFMKFYVMMDVILFSFNDWNLIVVPTFILLIKLTSNWGINDQILTNNNIKNASQKHDDEKFVDQLGDSIIIDNTSEMFAAVFGNSRKQLIIYLSFFIPAHSAHVNNLNDHYFHFRIDPFANCYITASMFSELVFAAKIDTTVNWHAISAMWDQLLTDTFKTEVAFANLPIICEPRSNAAIIREYNAEQVYLYNTNTQLANFYYRNKVKDDFEARLTKPSFAEHSIALYREARVECLEYTNAVFDTLLGNITKQVAENETKSGHHDSFNTIMITLHMCTQRCSSCL